MVVYTVKRADKELMFLYKIRPKNGWKNTAKYFNDSVIDQK